MSFALPTNMPSLKLSIPAAHSRTGNIELNEYLLNHWVKRLPDNNPVEFTQRYLDALELFNHNQVFPAERLKLLDIYRIPFNQQLLSPTMEEHRKKLSSIQRLNLIQDEQEVFNRLAIGYKIVLLDASQANNDLVKNSVGQLAVYRVIEQLSYLALHAYKYYRKVPQDLLRELHQVYLLSIEADISDEVPFVNKQLTAEHTFKQRYIQLLLTCICNPYGLDEGEAVQTYKLMLQLASAAKLTTLKENEVVKAGHFYINCLSDNTPIPTVLPKTANYDRLPTLNLDTKSILTKVYDLFEQADKVASNHRAMANINLLKKVVPYLNTSYERKQPRLPVEGEAETYISVGLDSIHNALTQGESLPIENHQWLQSKWEVLNRNNYGYLVQKRKVKTAHDLNIGDFVGIFEQNEPSNKISAKLASIRWLRTDDFEQTKMGLKFIEGDAIPVAFTTADNDIKLPAFLIPTLSQSQEAACLITQAGIFKTGGILHIKMRKKILNFSIKMDDLVESNHSYERFTFKEQIS